MSRFCNFRLNPAGQCFGIALFLLAFIYVLLVLRTDEILHLQQPSKNTITEERQIAKELWNPFGGEQILKSIGEKIEHLRFTLDAGRKEDFNSTSEVRRILRYELNTLEEELGIKKWKLDKSRELGRKIAQTLDTLQNPKHCDESRMLFCPIMNGNGLGSGAQNLLWCVFNAYIERKMVVMVLLYWEYTPNGWDTSFKPISRTCPYSVEQKNHKIFWSDWSKRDLLTYLPSDLAEDLLVLGSNPLAWWYGQLLGYYLQPSSSLDQYIQGKIRDLNYTNPIVGVHIRRSDKIGKEGAFHSVDEYMAQVENYFKSRALKGEILNEKKVFISTDDPKAIHECIQRYPEYNFIYNPRAASEAEKLESRYHSDSVKDALLDIYLLAKSNFFIGTFSSGFSRLAYILMQYYNEDALDNVYSLDVEFHYVGALNTPRLAIYDHAPQRPKDLNFSKGDLLLQPHILSLQDDSIKGKIRDGFSWGEIRRSKEQGNYPLYKTKPIYRVVNVTQL